MTLSEWCLRPQRTSYYWLPLCLSNPEKLMGPEAKLYKKIKKATPTISWNRIENLAFQVCQIRWLTTKNIINFFTVEFKVTKGNKVNLVHIKWHGICDIHTTRSSALSTSVHAP